MQDEKRGRSLLMESVPDVRTNVRSRDVGFNHSEE